MVSARIHHELHVVLDQQHGGAALGDGSDRGREALCLVGGKSRRRLVEQQQARARGERTSDLKEPLLAVRECTCFGIDGGLQADESEQLAGLRLDLAFRPDVFFGCAARPTKSRPRCGGGNRPGCSPEPTDSGNSCTSWKVRTRPAAAIASGGRAVMSLPPKMMRPSWSFGSPRSS